MEAPRPTGSSAAMWSSAEIFGAPVTEPPGKTAPSSSASPTPVAQPPLDGRDHVRDAGELALGHQVGPAHRARLADAREVVALEVDDHHVLGGVLLGLAQLAADAGRPGALDRLRPDPVAAAGEEELGRGGDDRPAVARSAAAGGAAASGARRGASPAGSPSNGACRCWTRLTW